jgi:hypothetical protein
MSDTYDRLGIRLEVHHVSGHAYAIPDPLDSPCPPAG